MIDDTPDFPLDFIMITPNSDYVSLDLSHDLIRKLNGECNPSSNKICAKCNFAQILLFSFLNYLNYLSFAQSKGNLLKGE